MPHEIGVEVGRGGFRAYCGSCMWVSDWTRHKDRATVNALEHQYQKGMRV